MGFSMAILEIVLSVANSRKNFAASAVK